MRFKSTLVLLALVLVLGGYAYLFEGRSKPKPGVLEKAFAVSAPAVQRLQIQQEGKRIALEREGNGWKMTEPLQVRASTAVLDELLKALGDLEVQQRLEKVKPGPGFGLSPPVLTLTFWADQGAQGLSLGNETPDARTVYAVRLGTREVILIPKAFAEQLRKGVNAFRDRALVSVDRAGVERLSLTYPDRKLTAARGDGGWRLSEPCRALAGQGEVEGILDSMLMNPVEDFVADGVADFSPYGLDRPRLELALWERGRGEPLGYAVGSRSKDKGPFERYETFYARPLGTASVMTIKVARVDDYVKEIRHLRPRRLLAGAWEGVRRVGVEGPGGGFVAERGPSDRWEVLAPAPGPLETARWNEVLAQPLRRLEAVALERAEPLRLKALGFDHPLGRITLDWEGSRQVLTVGSVDAKAQEATVTCSGEDLLFTVPASILEVLSQRILDLRDPVALSVSLAAFRELVVDGPEGPRVYETRAKGSWIQTKPGRREGELAGLSEILGSLSSLHADRWVAAGPRIPWAEYGLEPPSTVLRFSLIESDGSPKTHILELGHRNEQAGGTVYARLDQADELMLLPARFPEALGELGRASAP